MITATLENADGVAAWLAGLGPKAAAASEDAAGRLLARLTDIADRKLSGEILNARSGKLRASLRATLAVDAGIAATVTADTPYAAFQEYCFDGVEGVREFFRRQVQAFGRPIAPVTVAVRAHDRQVRYPAHSYLRSALAELEPEIAPTLAQAAAKALAP